MTRRRRAALVVSELTSNAIQAHRDDYSLSPRVDDVLRRSRTQPPDRQPPPAREMWRPAPDTPLRKLLPRGRGLAIVDSLSEEVTVEHHGDDVVVTARVRVDYEESGPSW